MSSELHILERFIFEGQNAPQKSISRRALDRRPASTLRPIDNAISRLVRRARSSRPPRDRKVSDHRVEVKIPQHTQPHSPLPTTLISCTCVACHAHARCAHNDSGRVVAGQGHYGAQMINLSPSLGPCPQTMLVLCAAADVLAAAPFRSSRRVVAPLCHPAVHKDNNSKWTKNDNWNSKVNNVPLQTLCVKWSFLRAMAAAQAQTPPYPGNLLSLQLHPTGQNYGARLCLGCTHECRELARTFCF